MWSRLVKLNLPCLNIFLIFLLLLLLIFSVHMVANFFLLIYNLTNPGNQEDILKPTLNTTLKMLCITQIVAGWEHSVALTSEGILYSWGCGYKDSRRGVIPPVLGIGSNEGRMLPERIACLEEIKIAKVTCGWDHCLALDVNGKVLSWGSGQNGTQTFKHIFCSVFSKILAEFEAPSPSFPLFDFFYFFSIHFFFKKNLLFIIYYLL